MSCDELRGGIQKGRREKILACDVNRFAGARVTGKTAPAENTHRSRRNRVEGPGRLAWDFDAVYRIAIIANPMSRPDLQAVIGGIEPIRHEQVANLAASSDILASTSLGLAQIGRVRRTRSGLAGVKDGEGPCRPTLDRDHRQRASAGPQPH